MAGEPIDTFSSERRAFVTALRGDRAFLLRHLPALGRAIARRFRNRLTIAVSSRHRGRKRRPPWLDPSTEFHAAYRGALSLPSYPCRIASSTAARQRQPFPSGETGDPESVFAENRWLSLMTSLLEGAVDWRGELEACIGWIETHSDRNHPAWETYSACERVANLLTLLALQPPEQRVAPLPAAISEFLQDSLDWIHRHLEYYGPADTNNHILQNARALVMGGAASGNRAAFAAGMKVFRNSLPLQILDGGFLRERSSHYQFVTLNWILDAWRFAEAAGEANRDDAAFLQGYSARMLSAAAMLHDSAAAAPVTIGDVSPDATPAQSLRRLALLYGDCWPLPPGAATSPPIVDGWFRLGSREAFVLGNFPAGTYPPAFPTHGHGDLTSFVWVQGQTEILTDPGRYRYTPDAVSLAQLSAAGHNVPIVDGFAPVCESLVPGGRWWPQPHAGATLESAARGQAIELSHDGFARTTRVRHHSRRIRIGECMLEVADSFDGAGVVSIALCWHFGTGFESFDAAALAASGPAGRLAMQLDGAGPPSRTECHFGDSPASWISPVYGAKRPGLVVLLHWRVRLPVALTTSFRLS